MKIFSNNANITYEKLFSVFYHDDYSTLVDEEESRQMSREDGQENFDKIFEHPTIDLTSLFNRVRTAGELSSSQEVDAIQDFIQECKQDIQVLSSKLPGLISAIGLLCRELSETSCRLSQRQDQAKLGEYLLLQNTPKMLPQDVLEQIFLACLDPRDSERRLPTQAPLQASVCHRWRTIALSMPKLWEGVSIKAGSGQLSLAKAWIQRCPSYRLTITVDEHPTRTLHNFTHFLKASPSKPRLLEITFRCDDGGKSETWTPFPHIDCAELEELVIRSSWGPVEPPVFAPQLKRLCLFKTPESWRNTPPPSQLSVLALLSKVEWSMVDHILTHCQALQCLVVSISDVPPSSGVEREAISHITTLHHLHSFSIIYCCVDDDIAGTILHGFAFPVLNSFEFDCSYFNDYDLWLTALSFIHQIRKLKLSGLGLSATVLKPVLTVTTCLEELWLGPDFHSEHIEEIIALCSSLRETPAIAPSLQGIEFSIESFSEIKRHATSLIGLIRSMSRPLTVQRLKYLNIGLKYGGHDELEKFRSSLGDCEGINLKISTSSHFRPSSVRGIPFGFGRYTLPSNDVQERDILQPDGTWKKHIGHVYHCRITIWGLLQEGRHRV